MSAIATAQPITDGLFAAHQQPVRNAPHFGRHTRVLLHVEAVVSELCREPVLAKLTARIPDKISMDCYDVWTAFGRVE